MFLAYKITTKAYQNTNHLVSAQTLFCLSEAHNGNMSQFLTDFDLLNQCKFMSYLLHCVSMNLNLKFLNTLYKLSVKICITLV